VAAVLAMATASPRDSMCVREKKRGLLRSDRNITHERILTASGGIVVRAATALLAGNG
jgi:hypothetical protein